MASGPITSWQIGGETVETVTGFVFLGSKITADGDCSHEIKRCLLLGRKAITNLDSILKSRDITLLTNASPNTAAVPCSQLVTETVYRQRTRSIWGRESPGDKQSVLL